MPRAARVEYGNDNDTVSNGLTSVNFTDAVTFVAGMYVYTPAKPPHCGDSVVLTQSNQSKSVKTNCFTRARLPLHPKARHCRFSSLGAKRLIRIGPN